MQAMKSGTRRGSRMPWSTGVQDWLMLYSTVFPAKIPGPEVLNFSFLQNCRAWRVVRGDDWWALRAYITAKSRFDAASLSGFSLRT